MNLLEFQTRPNPNAPSTRLLLGGQPDEAQLQALQAEGVHVVINMRPNQELQGFPEREIVEAMGMAYEHLPVQSPADFSLEQVKRLAELLDQYAGKPVLVHCASGNRVGALFALKAFYLEGCDTQSALDLGEAYGMTKLRPFIAELLSKTESV